MAARLPAKRRTSAPEVLASIPIGDFDVVAFLGFSRGTSGEHLGNILDDTVGI